MRISNLFTIGTSGINDIETRNRIVLANKISLAFGLALLIITPTFCSFANWKLSVVLPLTIEFIANSAVLLLNHKKHHTAAAILLYLLQCVAIVYFSILLGRLIRLELAIILLISILYLIFREKHLRKLALGAAIIELAILEVVHFVSSTSPVILLTYRQSCILHLLIDISAISVIIIVSKPYVQSNDSNAALKRANHFIRLFVAE